MSPDNSLFLTEASLGAVEKVAITKMSRDPEKWEREILDALHEQNPFLQDYNIRFHLNKSDPEAGMGVGQVVIDEKIAVPIIIDDLKLQPLDLFWYEGKLQPLSKDSLEKAISATSLGKPVSPGQGEVSDVSLYGATRVPFSGKYSFAEDLTFTLDQLNAAISSLGKEGADYALRTSPAFLKGVDKYAEAAGKEPMEKEATVKLASAKPVEFTPFQEVTEPGFYEVLFDNIRKMSALAFDKVVDWDGEIIPRKTVVYGLDGSFAVSEKVGGIKKVASDETVPEDPEVDDVGFFWSLRGGSAIATLPARIMYKGSNEDLIPFIKVAELSTGKERTIFVSDEFDGIHVSDEMTFLDTNWNWSKVQKTATVADPTRANENEWPPHTVEVRQTGNLYSLHGLDVPSLPKEGAKVDVFYDHVSKMLDPDDLLELMQTADKKGSAFAEIPVGFSWEDIPEQNKYAGLLSDFELEPLNLVQTAARLRPSKVEFFKIAQEVTDNDIENTVDSLLGLNFITEENVGKFIEKIAMLEEAKDVLAKTLLSARLGLQMEQGPVKTALFSLDSVIRQLRYLRDYASML
jgi:hypothetical protein